MKLSDNNDNEMELKRETPKRSFKEKIKEEYADLKSYFRILTREKLED